VIRTETTTAPTSTSHPGAAAAAGAAAATKNESETDEGLPGWAWGLIGVAVGGGAIWAILAYRHRRADDAGRGRPPGGPADGPPAGV
jgi:hypothetical protein